APRPARPRPTARRPASTRHSPAPIRAAASPTRARTKSSGRNPTTRRRLLSRRNTTTAHGRTTPPASGSACSRENRLASNLPPAFARCASADSRPSRKQGDLLEPHGLGESEHQIHVLHGLAPAALDQVVTPRAADGAARTP